MRCFLSIELPSGIREKLFSSVSEAKDTNGMSGTNGIQHSKGKGNLNVRASFTKKEQLHITLLFLGEKTEEEVEKITAALRSFRFKKFQIAIAGSGFFPSEKFPRIFWIGTKDTGENTAPGEHGKNNSGALKQLHLQIANLLSEKPEKDFKGHVTVARIKSPENIEKLIALKNKLSSISFGSFEVSEIVLKKSTLTPNGAVYEDVGCFPRTTTEKPKRAI